MGFFYYHLICSAYLLVNFDIIKGISIFDSQLLANNDYKVLQSTAIPPGYIDGNFCNRKCNGKALKCFYSFTLAGATSMSNECQKCPSVLSDCWRPGCIVGGGIRRNVSVVNHQLPGPPIEVCEGDKLMVFVQNNLKDDMGTTIHWHGLHLLRYKYMDGVPMVTQCPIPEFHNFTYEFQVENSGTHWWHSHVADFQRGDGIFGALIIRQTATKNYHFKQYDYDLSSHLMMITEWNDRMRTDVFQDYNNPNLRFSGTGILVNGLGYQSNTNLTQTPPANFQVKRGYRYRFRLINVSFYDCPIEISIDDHQMLIIATDGKDLEPIKVNSFVSTAGERFDFVLNADQPIGTYYIRLKGFGNCKLHKVYTFATLQYKGSRNSRPRNEFPTYATAGGSLDGVIFNPISTNNRNNSMIIGIDEAKSIKSLEKPLLISNNIRKFYIELTMSFVTNPKLNFTQEYLNIKSRTAQLNGITNQVFNIPYLQGRFKINSSEFCNEYTMRNTDCRKNFCQCPHVLEVPQNAIVEFIFIEAANFIAHPMHLHGHSFRVLGWQKIKGNFTKADIIHMDQRGLLKRNFVNPPIKDTVSVPKNGYTIVRFIANNIGYWMMHCHIGVHSFSGMDLILKVGSNEAMPPVPRNFPTC